MPKTKNKGVKKAKQKQTLKNINCKNVLHYGVFRTYKCDLHHKTQRVVRWTCKFEIHPKMTTKCNFGF